MNINQAEQILGVSPNATEPEVRAAYRKLAFEKHPDRGGSTEAMQEVNNAMDAYKAKFKEGVNPEPKEAQSDTYGQQRARSADRTTAEGRAQYNEQYENEGQDKSKESRYQQSEAREDPTSRNQEDYEKHTYQPKYNSTFYDAAARYASEKSRFTSDRNPFEESVFSQFIGTFNKASVDNEVLKKFLKELRERRGSLDQTDFVKALIRKARELTNSYFIFNRDVKIKIDLEYISEVKKSFLLVLAILNKVHTLYGLDDELNLIKTEISSESGAELWNELKQPGDLTYRMYVVRAILNGRSIEDVLKVFKEQNREGLEQFANAEIKPERENITRVDFRGAQASDYQEQRAA